ncbi:hypothetical protein MD484_g425, partial [Candolleomyces efflorescens]
MKARWPNPRPWDTLQSFNLEFTGYEWMEPLVPNSNDTIYHHFPPVTSLDLTLPSVEELCTIDDEEEVNLFIPEPFLAKLQTLNLACDWNTASILSSLQFCTSLQNLSLSLLGSLDLYFDGEMLDGQVPEGGLPLPQLRVLRLRYATPSAISGFLEVVNTPFLEELDVSFELVAEGTRSTVRDLDVDILDLVERSGCEIRRLTIATAVFNRSEELTAILHGLPSLTHLLLHNTIFDLWVFRNFSCHEMLPHLEVFEMFDCPASDWRTLDVLCRFFEVDVKRSLKFGGDIRLAVEEERPTTALKKLYVTLREPVPIDFERLEDSAAGFRKLDGVEVRFCSIPHDTKLTLDLTDPTWML